MDPLLVDLHDKSDQDRGGNGPFAYPFQATVEYEYSNHREGHHRGVDRHLRLSEIFIVRLRDHHGQPFTRQIAHVRFQLQENPEGRYETADDNQQPLYDVIVHHQPGGQVEAEVDKQPEDQYDGELKERAGRKFAFQYKELYQHQQRVDDDGVGPHRNSRD